MSPLAEIVLDPSLIDGKTLGGLALLLIGAGLGGKSILGKVPGIRRVLSGWFKQSPASPLSDSYAESVKSIRENFTAVDMAYQEALRQIDKLQAELIRRDTELEKFAANVKGPKNEP